MTVMYQILQLQHSVLEKRNTGTLLFMFKVCLSKIVMSLLINVLEVDMKEPTHLQVQIQFLAYHYQNAGQNDAIKITNRSVANVALFKYLGMIVTIQNLIHVEMKRRLNLGNVCYHSVQNFFSSCLLSKNIQIRTYKTMILSMVLSGCVT
jgi:hypothetical protein